MFALLPVVLLVAVLNNVHGDDVPPSYNPRHPMGYKYSRVYSSSDPAQEDMSAKVKQRIDNIEKSIGDSRIYRGLVLNNGLTVLLISDPDTDKSAASLSVAVG